MAFGDSTFSNAGGAVSDLYAASGMRMKAKGSRLQADNYDRAAQLAKDNETFAATSSAIKQHQADRSLYQTLGQEQADIAGSGLSESGSGLDILRDSAAQGALTKAVLQGQGWITEHGFEEQAKSYTTMAEASRLEADAQDHAATGMTWAAGIKGAAAVTSLFTGGPSGGIPNIPLPGGGG